VGLPYLLLLSLNKENKKEERETKDGEEAKIYPPFLALRAIMA
jgi:hypothetical protein